MCCSCEHFQKHLSQLFVLICSSVHPLDPFSHPFCCYLFPGDLGSLQGTHKVSENTPFLNVGDFWRFLSSFWALVKFNEVQLCRTNPHPARKSALKQKSWWLTAEPIVWYDHSIVIGLWLGKGVLDTIVSLTHSTLCLVFLMFIRICYIGSVLFILFHQSWEKFVG